MQCIASFKVHVLRLHKKVESNIQLRNVSRNSKVKLIFDNHQTTEGGSEWSVSENNAKTNGCPISDDAYRYNLSRCHSPKKSFFQ